MSVFVVPPFQVPDEPQHVYKAWDITQGNIICDRSDYTVPVASGIVDLANYYSRDLVEFVDKPGALRASDGYALNTPEQHVYTQFCGYNPASYGIAAFATMIARTVHGDAVLLVWCIRIAHLLFATLCLWIALRVLPFGKPVLAFFALLPTTIFQLSSASVDAIAVPLLMVWTSVALWAAGQRRISRQLLVALSALSLVAVHAKPGYIFFVLLVLLVQPRHTAHKKEYWLWVAGTALAHIAVLYGVSLLGNASGYYEQYDRIDASGQLSFILHNPMNFAHLVVTDVFLNSLGYLHQIIGYFGWLSLALKPGVMVVGLLALLWALEHWKEHVEFDRLTRVILVSLGALGMLSLFAIAYIAWNPLMDIKICCLQGRYFLPYLWLTLLGLWKLPLKKNTWPMIILVGTAIFLGAQMLITIFTTQYI